jgi:replicative DNA helicase
MLEHNLLGVVINNPILFENLKEHGNIFADDLSIKLYDIIDTLHKKNSGFTRDSIINYITEQRNFPLNEFYKIYDSEFEEEKYIIHLNDILARNLVRKVNIYGHQLNDRKDESIHEIKATMQAFIDNIKLPEEKNIQDTKDACYKLIEKLKQGFQIPKVHSAIEAIDDMQRGYKKTDFILIAAGESVGKTSYIIQRIIKQAQEGVKVGLISCEMESDEIYQLMACSLAGVDNLKLELNELSEVEKDKFINALERMYELPIFIVDELDQWDDVKGNIITMKQDFNVDMVYVDYLQMIDEPKNQDNDSRYTSKNLKKLAKKLKIPICALCAITKEGKKDEEPETAHIRGNGKIANDADVVIMMKTINESVGNNGNARLLRFFVKKNRGGRRLNYDMIFNCPMRRFVNPKLWYLKHPPSVSNV